MRTRIEHEIFRYLLLAGSRVFASSRGNHMATQRPPQEWWYYGRLLIAPREPVS